jgi:hypothetical protein
MGGVLDGHYLCIQLSWMSLAFLDGLIACWKHHFRIMVFFWRVCLKVDEDEEMVVSEGVLTIYRFRPSLMPRNVEQSNDLSVVCSTDV